MVGIFRVPPPPLCLWFFEKLVTDAWRNAESPERLIIALQPRRLKHRLIRMTKNESRTKKHKHNNLRPTFLRLSMSTLLLWLQRCFRLQLFATPETATKFSGLFLSLCWLQIIFFFSLSQTFTGTDWSTTRTCNMSTPVAFLPPAWRNNTNGSRTTFLKMYARRFLYKQPAVVRCDHSQVGFFL